MTHIVTGYYGSGKTEFCLNLAITLAKTGKQITIADLDVVNPFFRSREREKALAPLGIDVMGSALENHVAQDVPALSFAFLSRIRAGQDVIIDLAGGEAGLRLLANCYADIKSHNFFCVFNLYRPETNSPDKMAAFCRQINAASRLSVTGLVNNGNLLGQTEAEHVLQSQKAVITTCEELNLPLAYTLVQEDIYSTITDEIVSEKVLTFHKPQMRENWQG